MISLAQALVWLSFGALGVPWQLELLSCVFVLTDTKESLSDQRKKPLQGLVTAVPAARAAEQEGALRTGAVWCKCPQSHPSCDPAQLHVEHNQSSRNSVESKSSFHLGGKKK